MNNPDNFNISFGDFIKISEGKQVGILYHFTRVSSIEKMIDTNFNLGSHQDYISFTRNFDMTNASKYSNDFTKALGDKRGARIVLDGDKLSKKASIVSSIIQIDMLNAGFTEDSQKELQAKTDIKINFVKSFRKYKR